MFCSSGLVAKLIAPLVRLLSAVKLVSLAACSPVYRPYVYGLVGSLARPPPLISFRIHFIIWPALLGKLAAIYEHQVQALRDT